MEQCTKLSEASFLWVPDEVSLPEPVCVSESSELAAGVVRTLPLEHLAVHPDPLVGDPLAADKKVLTLHQGFGVLRVKLPTSKCMKLSIGKAQLELSLGPVKRLT